jgi:cytochrome c oxidase subunit II
VFAVALGGYGAHKPHSESHSSPRWIFTTAIFIIDAGIYSRTKKDDLMPRAFVGIAMLVAVVILPVGNSRVTLVAAQGEVKEVTVSAKKFEFSPSEIRVKAGSRIRLIITSTDREHGIEINPIADGAGKKAAPGLKFDGSITKPEFKLPKDQATPIEFEATQPGTYSFKCSVICGMGHHNMKGKIIVEP